jgi:hypothetical protein
MRELVACMICIQNFVLEMSRKERDHLDAWV